MAYAAHEYSRTFLRLLRLGPFERRARGGWRFGTRPIAEHVVERLIAQGLARRDGDRIVGCAPTGPQQELCAL
jgi:hypothetical protein